MKINRLGTSLLVCLIVSIGWIGCSKDDNPGAIQIATISGRVTELHSGNPIAGAVISTQSQEFETTSDAQGNYLLIGTPPNRYSISVKKVGYFISSIYVTAPAGDTTVANLSLMLFEGGTLAGEERLFTLGDTTIEMVWIPAGSFLMGSPSSELNREVSEGPVHRTTFEHGFWMGKYEVTQGQWLAVTGDNQASRHGVGAEYPVYNTSWNDVQSFTHTLGGVFRLPSESEWEYACRAGATTRFYWGEDSTFSMTGSNAWYVGNSGASTHPVGIKGSNEWGLFDMSGNVWEWCEDFAHNDYIGIPDNGSAWIMPSSNTRVLRGGSWKCPDASFSRSARRLFRDPTIRFDYVGLRLVCSEGF